jgi:hypothetical protein
MKKLKCLKKLGTRIFVFMCAANLNSCVGVVVGSVVDSTLEVAKVPFKVAETAAEIVIPDKEDD